jgi:hypothetical protein
MGLSSQKFAVVVVVVVGYQLARRARLKNVYDF